ncbi:hypothetical protein [Cupriavidus sp. AU9028]|uniref:hypothetical protein n=1 Tax=Cupriavidus sp. AU9028 TaxID=2871157 RepID=UPI001C977DC7|nr:hypothetical protein [Cupriavidus sp. AU9028]MBY4898251.1 hypothetical protein [Cupriavidus sp. AU9028]
MSEFFQDHPMLLFALEAGVALLLLVFIVVWTMGTAKKNPRPLRAPADHPSRSGEAVQRADKATPAPGPGTEQPKDNPPA